MELGVVQKYAFCCKNVSFLTFSSFNFSLPKGLQIGRQEIQAVAQQRKHDIARYNYSSTTCHVRFVYYISISLFRFLKALFSLDVKVSQSDVVYTFFHPLLRDQEDANIHLRKLRGKQKRATWVVMPKTMIILHRRAVNNPIFLLTAKVQMHV